MPSSRLVDYVDNFDEPQLHPQLPIDELQEIQYF